MAIYTDEGTVARPGAGVSRRLRLRATGFLILALVAGTATAYLITSFIKNRTAHAASLQTVKIAVAATDLPVATTVKPEMIKMVDWPQWTLPSGSFTDATLAEGRVTSIGLVAGEPIVETRLAKKGTGMGMAAMIPSNMRAMTVKVNDVIGVAGFIHPGDFVDVLTTMQTPRDGRDNAQTEFRSKIVLQNIRVLAIGEDMVEDSSKPQKVPVVTLLVNPEQSERLALASTHGELQLTMRSQIDQGDVPTPGVSPPELLGQINPAPIKAPAKHAAAPRVVAQAPAPQPQQDVVEVLRGDLLEERKMRTKESK